MPEDHPVCSEIEYSTVGYYEPGFIHLNVEELNDLSELNKLGSDYPPPPWASTFLHEYVHFIQDLTSTHGLLSFHMSVDYLKNSYDQVVGNEADEFSIPLKFTNEFNLNTNILLRSIYQGLKTPDYLRVKSVNYLSYSSEVEDVINKDGDSIKTPKYKVKYHDNGADTPMHCHFGAIHIKEYMAHAIQNQFEPGKPHDDLPYLIVELILRKEVPEFADNPLLMIALCDASLMDFHPAHIFFVTVERMKAEPHTIPKDVDAVYEYTFKNLTLDFNGKSWTIDSLYISCAQRVSEAFRGMLRDDVFKDNVTWFEKLIESAILLRTEKPGFVTRLVELPGRFSHVFFDVIDALGIPLTTNRGSKGFFAPPGSLEKLRIKPYYHKAFQAISNTFSGVRKCSLHAMCESMGDEKFTNDDCLNQPWERALLSKLCPYAQLWKTWGLQGKTPLSTSGSTRCSGPEKIPVQNTKPMSTSPGNPALALRRDLLSRAETYVTSREINSHVYRSRGKVPTVLFRPFQSDGNACHGNFQPESFAAITPNPEWARRLTKPHSGKNHSLLESDSALAMELDSCTSSDALAMNIFCHPSSATNQQLARLFGFEHLPDPTFGFKAKLPFVEGTEPRSTEIDLCLHSPNHTVLAECKLTESDFTSKPNAGVERYAAFAETFDATRLPQKDGHFLHYQLIRNVLAAVLYNASFSLICDQRRPDLIAAFEETISAIRDKQLQHRCSVLTWQEIAATTPSSLRDFLAEKYGIE